MVNRKILVTGYTGKVAPAIVSRLETDFDIKLFCRREVESKHEVFIGDLTSPENCIDAMSDVSDVIHLAALSQPAPTALNVNVTGTYNILEAARMAGVKRFIFASTNCVYGHCFPISDRGFPLKYLPIDESHPLCPEDNYGISKALAERLLEIYSQTWELTTAAFRLSWVWGDDEIKWRLESKDYSTEKFAQYFWSYVDLRDVVNAFWLALTESDLPQTGVYNITAADTMSEINTSELISQYYPHIETNKVFSGRDSLFDISRAKRAFNYQPQYSWKVE